MKINPKLNDIDDCLYRVAVKAFIKDGNKVLLVKETPEMWWGLPGGGVDHGESVEVALMREVEEEIGVPKSKIKTDFIIAHHSIGSVVNTIPRMNLYFEVTVPKDLIIRKEKLSEVADIGWFTRHEFMELNMSPSFNDRKELARAIFDKNH